VAAAKAAALCDPVIYPTGFTIHERPVAITFAHNNIFVPATQDGPSVRASLVPGAPESWVTYWDEQAYLAEYSQVQPATESETSDKKEVSNMETELNAFYGDLEAERRINSHLSAPASVSAAPGQSKPLAVFSNSTGKHEIRALHIEACIGMTLTSSVNSIWQIYQDQFINTVAQHHCQRIRNYYIYN
jgi:hypothetical protein